MQREQSEMVVAAAQIDVELHDVERNIDKHLDYISDARKQGVELLVFPELSLTGYLVGERGWEIGMPVWHDTVERLARAADQMRVVVGFVEEGFAAQFFNAAALLRAGQVEFVHRKVNLANYGDMEEGKYFAGGRYIETFELKRPFVGATLICSDLWNPGLVHLAALHGATCLLAPTNSSLDERSGDTTKPARWDIFLQHYAMIYGLPIVFANRVGREEGHVFWGGSRILGPRGEPLQAAAGDEEVLLVAELSFDDVRKARYELPTVRDSNLALIAREVERLALRVGVPNLVRDL
jgi:predicted amidohydrolase